MAAPVRTVPKSKAPAGRNILARGEDQRERNPGFTKQKFIFPLIFLAIGILCGCTAPKVNTFRISGGKTFSVSFLSGKVYRLSVFSQENILLEKLEVRYGRSGSRATIYDGNGNPVAHINQEGGSVRSEIDNSRYQLKTTWEGNTNVFCILSAAETIYEEKTADLNGATNVRISGPEGTYVDSFLRGTRE
jgi:hypothetical protein